MAQLCWNTLNQWFSEVIVSREIDILVRVQKEKIAYFSLHLFTVNQRFDISHEQSDFFYRNITQNIICFCLDLDPHFFLNNQSNRFFTKFFQPWSSSHLFFCGKKKSSLWKPPTGDPLIRFWWPLEPLRRCQVLNHSRGRRWSKSTKIAWKNSSLLVLENPFYPFFWKVESWVISGKKDFLSWHVQKE